MGRTEISLDPSSDGLMTSPHRIWSTWKQLQSCESAGSAAPSQYDDLPAHSQTSNQWQLFAIRRFH